jgi:uncharacterized membrane protein
MENFTFYFLILIVAIVASRIVSERALKQLSTEEKGTLLDSFSSYRLYNTVVILGLVVAYIAATSYFPRSYSTLTLIFIILFFTISGTVSVLSYQKLKNLTMPSGYIRSFLISLAIQYAGVAAIFLPMVWQAIEMQR